jgi:hypothetical protein
MAQLPDLGRLALRPRTVPTGAGDGKKQKQDNPERDLIVWWGYIIKKVFEYENAGGGAFFQELVPELNRRYPGLIPKPSEVDWKRIPGATNAEKQREAKRVITQVFRELTKKRRAEGLPVLGPAKAQKKKPTADQAARQRNAQQSQHLDGDRESDAPRHFSDERTFVEPQPWPTRPDTTDQDRQGDLRRKSPPELNALVAKRDADGGRCCAANQ